MWILRIPVALGLSAVLLLLGSADAYSEKRVALVVGNGAYQRAGQLNNPVNDARAIAAMLQSAGFDRVEVRENLDIRELRQAIKEFSDMVRDADTAVVYYSGHGIEVNGVNYLVPTDAILDRDIDVPYEAFSLENLVQVLEPARRLRLIMLDACRDNPFARSMKRTIGARTVGRGLAPVEPTTVNTLIGFAAKAGSIALDGEGANSPYALALLNNIPIAGLDLRIAFGRVRDDVLKTTKNRQEPFVYGSLGGSSISIVDAPSIVAPPAQAGAALVDRAAQAWAVTKDTISVAVLEDFIGHFGSTIYGSMARARLEELKKGKVAVAIAPKNPSAAAPPSDVAANVWAVTQGTTSIAVLEDFIRQYGKTPYGSMARARLAELKKTQVAAVPPKPTEPKENAPKELKERCPNITGTWNSWASGLFGKADATFNKDGTCVHRSGIKGKWWCESGQLRMAWGGENPKTFRLSPDGKRIIHIADGAVGFSRD